MSIIEQADFGTAGTLSRAEYAASEARDFFDSEFVRLMGERRQLREQQVQTDDDSYDELQRKIEEKTGQIDALERNWKSSSLNRRYIMTHTQRAEQGLPRQSFAGSEKRIAVAASDRLQLVEPNAKGKGNEQKLTGYAALYNSDSVDLGGFIETLAIGCFDNVVKTCDCRFLVNHDSSLILGRRNKNLRLYSDRNGLLFYNDLLPGDLPSMEAVARVQSGIWSQCSFQFVVGKTRWEYAKRPGGLDLRIIEEIKELLDVSVVSYPAYEKTSIKVITEPKRSLDDADPRKRFGGFATEEELLADIEEEGEFYASRERDKKKKIESQYLLAGRIINRCKASLLQ
jgi:HK97 family phage prohead protease